MNPTNKRSFLACVALKSRRARKSVCYLALPVATILLYAAAIQAVLADTVVWQGGLFGNWSDANNWNDITLNTNKAPTASDNVYTENGGPNPDGADAAANVYIGYGV